MRKSVEAIAPAGSNIRMSSSDVALLLERLRSADAQAGWQEFLLQYSSVLYQTARAYTDDEDEASDCFVHICEQLVRNGFRRLLQFKTGGAASFKTWLRVVARNLCYDWHRKKHGRLRPFKSVQHLSTLELEVYRCRYECRLSRGETLRRLQATWPTANMDVLTDIESRLEHSLSSRQHWLLSAWKQRESSASISGTEEETWEESTAVIDTAPNPETLAVDRQQRARLLKSVGLLPLDERLIVHLRFEEELSLEEIAQLTGLGDAQRVHRRIAAILQKLQMAMETRNDRKITDYVRVVRQQDKITSRRSLPE
jgi:RNA polymerase sigma factor (sigma-70 family)